MQDIFENLGPNDISVHVMLNLQERYPNLNKEELLSYKSRVKLRISLLKEFAETNSLPLGKDLLSKAITGEVDSNLIKEICKSLNIPDDADIANTDLEKSAILLNGGPGTGKSHLIKALKIPEDTVRLDRDSYFEKLTPYPKLKHEAPDHATHAVVCEAILYNERDAYRYAILSNAQHLLVDGTMSYLDIGTEMIEFAQKHGYHVTVLNVDCPIEEAIRRAKERSIKTGKTINKKLLYESHVRCSLHFFHYRELADATENWRNDAGEENSRIAFSRKEANGSITKTIEDKDAFKEFKKKSTLPLDNPSWAPIFDDFLAQRKTDN